MEKFSKSELANLRKLKTPSQIQSFLNSIPINFEKEGETCMSPFSVLKKNKAHCMEGALMAYFLFKLNKKKSWLLHLKTIPHDLDHVICVYKTNHLYGAISKTNHSVLRFRDPVYKSVRELVMSYFHEYTNDNGIKTLLSYSKLLDLSKQDDSWITSKEDLWHIDKMLDDIEHTKIFDGRRDFLRIADKIEQKTGKIIEWKKR